MAGLVVILAIAGRVGFPPTGAAEPPEPPWAAALRRVDVSLDRHDVSAAVYAWVDAHRAALGRRGWQGMLEVGDAALRIADASASRRVSEGQARRAYLSALWFARRDGSLDGVLRVAQAFAALGDRDVVGGVIRIAEGIAARAHDPAADARVRRVAEELAGELVGSTAIARRPRPRG